MLAELTPSRASFAPTGVCGWMVGIVSYGVWVQGWINNAFRLVGYLRCMDWDVGLGGAASGQHELVAG